jgi:hypothetical protein
MNLASSLLLFNYGHPANFAFSFVSDLPSRLVPFVDSHHQLADVLLATMERYEMHHLRKGNISIGNGELEEVAIASNAFDPPSKDSSKEQQASPKVSIVQLMKTSQLTEYKAAFQLHADLFFLAYLPVKLGNPGFV